MPENYLRTTEKSVPEDALSLSRNSLYCLIAATLIVRVATMLLFQSWEFSSEWAYGFEMGHIGRWLAEGKGFSLDGGSLSAKFPPLYPLVVAGFFAAFGVYSQAAAIGLFLLQSLCAAVTALCLAVLGNRLFGRIPGLIAGFIWAFYPTSIFNSVFRIWFSELEVMLVLLIITIAVMSTRPPTFRQVVFLGGLSGLLILTDSTMTLYLPLLFLWVLFRQRMALRQLSACLALWVVVAGVVVSPWVIRNWLALGVPRLVKSNLGLELFTGNHSFASGTNDRKEMAQAFAALDQEELEHYRAQPEVVYYQYLKSKALEWIQAHPSRFFWLTVRRVWYFWVVISPQGREAWFHLAWYGPFAVLALFGLWSVRHRLWSLVPIGLFLLVYPLPYYLTHVARYRYRYPVEPMVILLAAIPLAIWFGRYLRFWHTESI